METPTWLVWFIAIVLAVNLVGGATLLFRDTTVEATVDLSEQNTRLDSLEGTIQELVDKPTSEVVEGEAVDLQPGSFVLSKSEFEDEAIEAEALRLATESVESRDFRKAAFDALKSYEETLLNFTWTIDIDSYKDITEVKVLDVDVDKNEVKFKIKLYYFLDEDEDETERARLSTFTVTVDDLDFDDDFEDGEVDEAYLDLLTVTRVYES